MKVRKTIVVLMLYLTLFTIFFAVAVYNYYKDIPVFEIGLSGKVTDIFLIVLSVLGILKTGWHIYSF